MLNRVRVLPAMTIYSAAVLSVVTPAVGQGYSFTKIAESASGGLSFSNVAPSVNAAGTVAFQASFDGGNGIYTGAGGAITTVVDTNSPTFSSFSGTPLINAAGMVAFFASRDGGGTGIFTHGSGVTTNIALSGAAGGGLFTGFGSTPSINATGTVAFWADRNSDLFPKGPGIFAGNGGALTTIVQHNDSDFRGIGVEATINDAGTVAFQAGVSGTPSEQGIFTRNGNVTKQIVQANLPGFGTIFNGQVGAPSINSKGTAAFLVGNNPEGRGIYFASGGQPLNTPDSGNPGSPTTVADSRGAFTNQISGVMSINTAGTIVFFAGLDNGSAGLFTGPDTVADKVIRFGDPLFGSSVSQLSFGRQGLNDAGQVAFHYQLANGQQGVALAVPTLEGDFNNDGSVDAADYVVWRKTDGAQGSYDTWRANFGRTANSGAGASTNAAVPEPATCVVLMSAVAGWCLRRRRGALRVPETRQRVTRANK